MVKWRGNKEQQQKYENEMYMKAFKELAYDKKDGVCKMFNIQEVNNIQQNKKYE